MNIANYFSTLLAEGIVFLCSVRRLLVAANIVPSSPILVTLMMEAKPSSETSVLTRAARSNIQDDAILGIIVPLSATICIVSEIKTFNRATVREIL
jgi:hypothetical protein